jgi:hypothetical protein
MPSSFAFGELKWCYFKIREDFTHILHVYTIFSYTFEPIFLIFGFISNKIKQNSEKIVVFL